MRLTIDPARGLQAELRGAALDRIARVAAAARTIAADPAKGPHATRKEIKKLRALVRLLRRFDDAGARAENERWRLVAASLAELREAAALVETVDRFLHRLAQGDGLRQELILLRPRLEARLAEMAADDRFLRALAENCIEAAAAGAGAIREMPLASSDIEAAAFLGEGALANWKEARRALRRARRHGREDDFHDLRKAAKRHAADLELLAGLWSETPKRRRRVDRLGDVLGELNDAFVMNTLRRQLGGSRALARFLARMRDRLARKSLKLARRVFRDHPGKLPRLFAKAVRRLPAASAPETAETSRAA